MKKKRSRSVEGLRGGDGGLPPSIRSMGWFVYQDFDGKWYARNHITKAHTMGYELLESVVAVLQENSGTPGLWIGQIGTCVYGDKCMEVKPGWRSKWSDNE